MAEKKSILIVEDDADLRFIFGEAVKQEGYDILRARSVDEAVKILSFDKPALILLDMNMPDASGLTLLEYMNENELSDIQVVVVSANEYYQPKAAQLGVEFFLIKPVSIQELAVLAKRLLSA
jgi:DNA-binding NtrC family response regulator